jgi:hypothetical protein
VEESEGPGRLPDHARNLRLPELGRIPLPEVTSADIRRVILAARDKAPEVARKLVFRIAAVFKWGIAEGMCDVTRRTSRPAPGSLSDFRVRSPRSGYRLFGAHV